MATKTKKRSGKKSEIKTLVVDFFNNHNKESFNYKQVAVDLGVTGRSDQYLIADILDDLTRDGYLVNSCRENTRLLKSQPPPRAHSCDAATEKTA